MTAPYRGTVAGAVLGLVAAILGVATQFGISLTTAQHDAIMSLATAVTVVAPFAGVAFDHLRHRAAAAAQPPPS